MSTKIEKLPFILKIFDDKPILKYQFAINGDGSKGEYCLSAPMSVEIGENRDIFVADTLNNKVKIFNQKGEFITEFGGQDLFNLPVDIKVKEKHIYVVDNKNSRIQVFDLKGNFIRSLVGADISKEIGAWIPVAIDIDEDDIYVTDVFYHRVIVFGKDGEFRRQFGVPGSGDGHLLYPNGICVDEEGNVYVADSNNGRIQVFDSEGRFISVLQSKGKPVDLSLPRGMALGYNKYLYVVDSFVHGIKIIELEEAQAERILYRGSRGTGDGEMNFPNDIAVGQGVLCIADRANNRILVYSAE